MYAGYLYWLWPAWWHRTSWLLRVLA